MDEITILDKTYISSKRAAEITGYAKDYVGQLCREGHVDAKMVGRSWYVFEPSIRKHRFGEEAVVEEEVLPEPEIVENTAPMEPTTPAWEPSVYKAESVDMIPELETVIQSQDTAYVPAPLEPLAPTHTSEDTHATLTDMQSAWREWFDRKQEARIEAPEPELTLPSGHDEDEFSVPIHRMQEVEDQSFPKEEIEDLYEAPDAEYKSEFAVPIQRIAPAPQPIRTASVHAPVAHTAPVAREEVRMGVIRKEKVTKRKTKRSKAGKRGTRTNAPIVAGLVAIAMISLAIAAVGTGYAERYLKGQILNNPVVNFLVGDSQFKR